MQINTQGYSLTVFNENNGKCILNVDLLSNYVPPLWG